MSDGKEEVPSLQVHHTDGVPDFIAPVPYEEEDDPQPYGSDFPLCTNCGKPYLAHIDVDYGASGLELCPTYTEYRSGLERDD